MVGLRASSWLLSSSASSSRRFRKVVYCGRTDLLKQGFLKVQDVFGPVPLRVTCDLLQFIGQGEPRHARQSVVESIRRERIRHLRNELSDRHVCLGQHVQVEKIAR